ncbi:hypothetical protein HMPREF9378_0836 [Streptococcus sanguinis SK1 = NCTC 7863]|uniref:Uncharacterized protein n=2 Tax=Streptococcus sanguinis TaxID=1305 RepID=F2CDS4_STRSA|nr:hypothetical protein HMPREF9390_0845 [Streptococcus sanguinis SK405]EGC27473.1 hypothetical protein HMPREF9392_1059 [Streptococcus sanguinis SK678]EGF07735.1 hypothetical protein HMPREF9378_0836 [Streptococcus sanguinis SK1 = NCTC 7863]EGF19452.1 hypothetical protein HMPREF9391_0940 [Streptococcus sanguinis SK408]EGF21055.1 hypothetical protein HMPREF9395_1428 [Streptococcus sanguinis SK1058]
MLFLQYPFRAKLQNNQKDFYHSKTGCFSKSEKAKQKDSSCAVAVLL